MPYDQGASWGPEYVESILSRLLHFADLRPDSPAVIDLAGSTSYALLRQRALATAGWLHDRGVQAGDTIAISLNRDSGTAVLSLALLHALAYLGAVALPLYADITAANASRLVRRTGARLIVSTALRPAVADLPVLEVSKFDWTDSRWSKQLAPRADDATRPFLYHFTSGTTGAAKIVRFTGDQFLGWSLARANPFGSSAADRQVPTLTWPSKVALKDLFRIHVFGGALVNLPYPSTWQELSTLIERFGVTQLSGAPVHLRRLLNSQRPPDLRVPPLRVLSVAGAAITPSEIVAARETITPNVYVDYGSTEISMVACLRPEDPVGVPGSVGRLISGIEGQAVGERDEPLRCGDTGLLRFRAAWMAHGYVDNKAATDTRFRGGWFYPGDVGSVSADGFVTLKGRSDDTINFAGIKITPADIEPELKKHPAVLDAVLAGVEDPRFGELPVAFIVLRYNVPHRVLLDFWRKLIDGKELPEVVMAVGQIPRNPEGKVLRDRLRHLYLAQTSKRGT